ncbi:MAG: ABC transporter permease [Chlamydiia bacterium]|nr:ABC transporter permease [Chlamydiia bacterium]
MTAGRFPKLITYLLLLFLYLPILILMVSSFNASRFGADWSGFSLIWYRKLFHDHEIWGAVQNSLIVGLTATLFATILGTLSAFALYRFKSKLQNVHYALIYSPLVIPDLLMGMSLLLLFVSVGFDLGLITIIIAHTTFCISYVAMVVLSKLEHFDFHVLEAAQDLGASVWTTFTKVVLPMLLPGIISGALLAFTISFDDFIVTSFVAGPGSSTLPIHVYGMIKFGATPVINALSTLILAVTFILAIATQLLTKESAA